MNRPAGMKEADRRNGASVISMGMAGALAERWAKLNDRYLVTVGKSADVVNSFGSTTKVLRLLRCDEMQGYLFSKPVPFEALTELLKAARG